MTPTRRIILTIGALALFAGCEMGLQEKLDDSKAQRFAAAKAAVYDIETARTAAIAASVPAVDAKDEDRQHPLLTWRKAVIARDDAKTLERIAHNIRPDEQTPVGARGTPAQFAAELGDSFLKESNEYWNGNSSNARYLDYIESFLESAAKHEADKREQGVDFVPPPFIDEARFDQIFVHAAGFFQLSLADNRVNERRALFPYWELAFDFPLRGSEDNDPDAYISRLCFMHESLKERCEGVPHEYRAAVLDRAYLEWAKAAAAGFKPSSERTQVFGDIIDRFEAAVTAELAKELNLVEEPVLPATLAKPGGSSGLRVLLSHKYGIVIGDKQIATEFGAAVPNDFGAKALEIINEIRNTPGNIITFTRAVLEAPATMTMANLRDIARALILPDNLVKNMVLVGRRKIDASLRRGVTNLQLMHHEAPRNSSYQFLEDPARTSCALMGFMGEPPVGQRKEFYLEIAPERIRAAPVSYDKETKEWNREATVDLGSPSDLSKLDAWLADNAGEIQVFISSRFSYEDGLMHLTRVLYECKDQEITDVDPSKDAVKRPCGAPTERRNTVVLSICG